MANSTHTRARASGSGNNAGKTRGKPFAPGNPGRPKGARHRSTVAIEQLLEGEAEAIGRVVIEKALAGEPVALRLAVERIAPVRKGRPVAIDMPKVENAAGVVAAIGQVLQALGDGRLTPEETATIANALEVQRRSLEVADLERRIEQLEQRDGSK